MSDAPHPGGCNAPRSALYLAPSGWAHACCWSGQTYGYVGVGGHRKTLLEVWHGDERRRLVAAVEARDFSHGCEACTAGTPSATGRWSGARGFDEFGNRELSDWPERIHLALSNTCNLQCVMCNGSLSSAIRSRRERRPPLPVAFGDEFFEELRAFLPHVAHTHFTGGEPFLCRATRRVWDQMLELDRRPATEVTTNATQWNDRVVRYIRELEMDLVVSIDGMSAEVNQAIRVGVDQVALREHVVAAKAELDRYGGRMAFNFCLLVANIHELGDLLSWADDLGVDVQIQKVTQPPRYSLFHLPLPELRAVVDRLEAQDGRLRAGLGRNRWVWDSELQRLRDQCELLAATAQTAAIGQAVAISAAGRADDVERAVATLRQWSGLEPFRADLVDEVIVGVSAPAWADWCVPADLVGADGPDLFSALSARHGPVRSMETTEGSPTTTRYDLRFDDAEVQAMRFEAVDPDGNRVDTIVGAIRPVVG